MKFTLTFVALVATAVVAVPTADADADPWCLRPGQSCWKKRAEEEKRWCMRPGQSCWKAKREAEAEADPWCMRPGQSCWKRAAAADAFAEAIHTSGGLEARTPAAISSNFPGGAAHYAKRSINELANLIALAENDPETFYSQLELENQFLADSEDADAGDDDSNDDGKTDDSKEEKRSGETKREPQPWCMRPGQSCWKRDAESEPEAEAEPWCMRPGQSCWKQKRAEEDKRWCMRPGQSCWKAKRAAEAVVDALREREAEPIEAKPFDPAYFAKRDAEPWCMRPGQSCWKAKRDMEAMHVVAREIIEAFE